MRLLFFVFITAFLLVPYVTAQTQNETLQSLKTTEQDIQQMKDAGFNTLRVEDLLTEAKNLFDAQSALEKQGGKPDYSFVITRTTEISSIKEKAFQAKDELAALEIAIAKLEGFDISPVNGLLTQVKQAFEAGRFEEAIEKMDETYQKISELQAATTRVSALLDAWRASLTAFVTENWLWLIIAGILIVIFVFVFGKRVSVYLIKRKIQRLNFEKQVIQNLIKDAQEKYFSGEMPENTYYIKIAKYAELTREVNRQLTVLDSKLKRKEIKGKVKGEKEKDFELKKTKKKVKKIKFLFLKRK